MPDPCVHITEFTDPACPWAFSAEPFRHRIDWLYEGNVEWEPRMVVLADTAQEQVDRGFTPEKLAERVRRHRPRPQDADRHPRAAARSGEP